MELIYLTCIRFCSLNFAVQFSIIPPISNFNYCLLLFYLLYAVNYNNDPCTFCTPACLSYAAPSEVLTSCLVSHLPFGSHVLFLPFMLSHPILSIHLIFAFPLFPRIPSSPSQEPPRYRIPSSLLYLLPWQPLHSCYPTATRRSYQLGFDPQISTSQSCVSLCVHFFKYNVVKPFFCKI